MPPLYPKEALKINILRKENIALPSFSLRASLLYARHWQNKNYFSIASMLNNSARVLSMELEREYEKPYNSCG